jgi:CO/xanthine dehydrogenase Mo-binding subunit
LDYQAILDHNNRISVWYEKDSRTYDFGRKAVPRELSWIGYDIPNIRYDLVNYSSESLLQSIPWRAVTANGFALSECFVDEIAEKLGEDPYAFRLSMLKEGREVDVGHTHAVSNTRLLRTLKLAVDNSDWGKPIENGRGRGLAVYPYLHGNGYCAIVAEVSVQSREIIVDKVTCGVDCGMVINPSGARNQIEGGVIWGMTALFYGGVEIKNGRSQRSNFHQNKMIRINECPEIDVHFVDDGGTQTWGTGEIANPVIAPAVLNAIYNASGIRIKKLPIVQPLTWES